MGQTKVRADETANRSAPCADGGEGRSGDREPFSLGQLGSADLKHRHATARLMPHAQIAPCRAYRFAQYARLARNLNLVCIHAALWIAIGERNGNLHFLSLLIPLFDDKLGPLAELRLAAMSVCSTCFARTAGS